MSSDDLVALRELSETATPGPWIRPWGATHLHAMAGDFVPSPTDLDFMLAAANYVRAALAAKPEPGLSVEQRIELARDMGRSQAEQDAVQVIGKIIAAVGGEVRVPDNLMVKDVSVSSDYANGQTVYHTRLSDEGAEG